MYLTQRVAAVTLVMQQRTSDLIDRIETCTPIPRQPQRIDRAERTPMRTRRSSWATWVAVIVMLALCTTASGQSEGIFWPSPESGARIENVTINGGMSPQTVLAGSDVTITLDYTIIDILCPNCIDQIQYGWINEETGAGLPVQGMCIYDGIPGPAGVSGSANLTIAAPTEPGTYALAFDRAQAFRCSDLVDWSNGPPRPVQQVGLINVSASPPQAEIPINPAGTYLRTDGDDLAAPATRIELADLGASPLSILQLRRRGRYQPRQGDASLDTASNLIAVFVDANGQFVEPGAASRVIFPVTPPSFSSNTPTDIAQDFDVGRNFTRVQIPQEAAAILFSPSDNFFADNSDPNGDYGVDIAVVNVTCEAGRPCVGGPDDDVILGTNGDDTIDGGGGNDVIDGGDGNDTISGGDGDDVISGGDGDDTIAGNAGNDTLTGDEGNDLILGGDGDDLLQGGDGDDILEGGFGNDILFSSFGDPTFNAPVSQQGVEPIGTPPPPDICDTVPATPLPSGFDILFGGEGDDTLCGDSGIDDMSGGPGNDLLRGMEANDTLAGNEDNDDIDGAAGDDYIDGALGNDVLTGGEGNDVLNGGDGDDTIDGGAGEDSVNGGPGNDMLTGGGENDVINGGDGDDAISGGDGSDQINGDAGIDTILGDMGDDNLDGGDGNDNLDGGDGNDQINGGLGDDILRGSAGDDFIRGEGGADDIDAGDGLFDLCFVDASDTPVGCEREISVP